MPYSTETTELHTWFERDRKLVELRETDSDRTIVEWRDDEVDEAVAGGLLPFRAFFMGRPDCGRLHEACVVYANEHEL